MKSLSLKNRLLLVSLIGIVMVAANFIVGGKFDREASYAQLEHASLGYTQALWQVSRDAFQDQLLSETKALTRSRKLVKALGKKDLAALAEHADPTLNRLTANGQIDGLVISDMQGQALFNSTGENLTPTMSEFLSWVAAEKKVKQDVVQITATHSGLLVGFPIYSRSKPKGVGAYFIGLDKIAQRLAQSSGMISGLAATDGSLLYSSDQQTDNQLDLADLDLGRPQTLMLEANDSIYSTTLLPLSDRNQAPVAVLILQSDASASVSAQRRVLLVESLAGILIFLGVAAAIFWQMGLAFKPLAKCTQLMQYIAAGDLSTDVECNSNNEIAQMLSGVEEMRSKLRTIVTALYTNTDSIQAVAREASDISVQASTGASRQQNETRSVATAMTQMSSTVIEVANNAVEAAKAADDANVRAKEGHVAVDQVKQSIETLAANVQSGAEAIEQVEQESESIGKILEVIRGIAEQTNLLALNAAIEAARAGEQGRGFAVVADEVRTLASRTQESTSEIQSMIERLQSGTRQAVSVMEVGRSHAGSSVQQAGAASDLLDAITESVARISMMNTQIATAAEQQGTVAEDINRSIISISGIADETAEGAHRSTESSQQVARLADELRALTSQFRL